MSAHRRLLQTFSMIVIVSILFSGFQPLSASAQSSDGIERQVNLQTGKVSFISAESGRALSASKALGTSARPADPAMALAKRFAPEFGVKNPERDLVEMTANRPEDGRVIVRYQQNYQGIPVMGGELIVNTNENGDLYSINGEVSPTLSLSTQPTIDFEQARQTALGAVAKWYGTSSEELTPTQPELWIYDESLLRPSTRPAELVWRIEVTSPDNNLPVRELVLVNAQRGSISLHFNQIDTAWSLQGSSGTIQNLDPTPTPLPTETPLSTETPEPVVIESPTEGTIPTEEVSVFGEPRAEAAATGATWYVSTTGNDSNSCSTPAAPCATMNSAIAKAAYNGDIVMVASGTYTGTGSNVVTIKKGLTLSGGWNSTFTTQDGASIIDGGGVRTGIFANTEYFGVVIDHFVIQNSHTETDGGGLYILGTDVTLKNSAVINNSAKGRGGGIYAVSLSTSTILNSTISNNSSGSSGGGIYFLSGRLSVNNATIAFNNANGTGGGILDPYMYVSLNNSILAHNTAVGGGADCGSQLKSSTYSIIGNTTGCTFWSGTGNLLDVDPLLETSLSGTLPLHVLGSASPAINAGDNATCPAIDQGGMPRPLAGFCDIGAYEYPALFINNGFGQSAAMGTSFALPLTVSLFDSSAKPVPGATITFTAPSSGASGTFADTGDRIATAITDSNGQATSSIFTANNISGSYHVVASVTGRSETANIHLYNNGDLFVSTTGSDSGTCRDSTSPCLTINGALSKAASTGDTIKVAIGTYTGSGLEVVLINKSITISGGWNPLFTAQTGRSTIDGQGLRQGVMADSVPTVIIDRFVIQNGFADNRLGGGILNRSSTMTLNNSIVTRNVTNVSGGGIHNYGTLTINNTLISENMAGDPCCSGGGGGGGINSNGILTMNNSTVTGNRLVGGFSGSGIGASGTVYANNSTISGNTGGYGEGIENRGTFILNNSTVSGNQSYGIDNLNGNLTLQNTIVAGNGSTGDCYNNPSDGATIISQGYNLIGNLSGCTLTPTTGDLVNVNPNLGELFGFPGSIPLLPGSPAIDAGNPASPGSGGGACLSTDQRGMPRPYGARCDIGAYEYAPPGSVASLSIVKGNGQRTAPNLAFFQPLEVAALDRYGSPVSGVTVTFTAPASGASGIFANTQTRITSAITDAHGIAAAPLFTANSQLGAYIVVVSTGGVDSVDLNLQNFAWYVTTNGNDANSCSVATAPCATINGAIHKASLTETDSILVATGTYTGTGEQVVLVENKSIVLSGGWNANFTAQNSRSTVDGQGARKGITTDSNVDLVIDHFIVQNGVGSGIYNYNSLLTLNNSFVINNVNRISGGGIWNHGTMIINNSTISNNIGGDPCCGGVGGGGGIDNHAGSLTINNSLISGNHLAGGLSGSGIFYGGDTLTLNNSTVSGNTGGDGSGIYVAGGKAVFNNSTISFNQSYGFVSGGEVRLQNTIVAKNRGGRDCYTDPSYSGTVTSQGYNLIGNATRCAFTATIGDLVGTDANPINPYLAPLQDYGGLTFTHALMPRSPALDAGYPATPGTTENSCLITDQRGFARPAGGRCDIGAFEVSGNSSTPTYIFAYAGTPQTIFKGRTSRFPLEVLILGRYGDSIPGMMVTFTAPATGASGVFTNTNTYTATATTDGSGIATSALFKPNSVMGEYTIVATAGGIANSANFQVTNSIAPVRTYTAGNSYLLPGTLLCNETVSSCTNGQNPRADKAHSYAMGMSDFLAAKHNRAGIDQNDMPIISTVDYCDPFEGCPDNNAFWNGGQMVYGNISALADDIIAHELTHGVIQYESYLFPYYQSGAVGESLSDLWGEYYDQTNSLGNDTAGVKWLIGEDISVQNPIRNMSNPPASGDPDKMSSPSYYKGVEDRGGIHTNSGVNNKAVYLMVDGGTFNGKTVSALGWEKTAAIYYEVNTNLLISGSDYSDLYYALQQACTNLIGQRGINAATCTEVRDAIDAVEMNSQPAANFNADIPYCDVSSPVIAFSDDLEAGAENWTFTNGNQPQRWQWDSPYGPYAQSGLHSLYADDYPDVVADATARLKSFVVPNNAYMHFAQAYGFETGTKPWDPTVRNFDGGVLEYSIDNGSTWLDAGSLIDFNGYTGTIFAGWNNPLKGRLAFVGSSHGYISTRLNLASLAGKAVTFRWRMGLDGAYYAWGWWVDNIKVYTCGEPTTFADVPRTHMFYPYIEAFYDAGITSGCSTSPVMFCPNSPVTRGQMAVFIEKALGNPSPTPSPTGMFTDVLIGDPFKPFIEQFYNDGITTGCAVNPLRYCPNNSVNRGEMAVFIEKALGNPSPNPSPTNMFADVLPGDPFKPFIEEFYNDGITSGCLTNPLSYCPASPVTRGQMAVFLVKALGIPMP